MGVFDSYKSKTTQEQRLKNLKEESVRAVKPSEEEVKAILESWPCPIIPIDFGDSIWENIKEYHKWQWNHYFHKNERMFIYHLGMALLAEHISEVKNENIKAFQQRLVYLQFGKDYPDIIDGFHKVLSYQEGKFIKYEKDVLTEVTDLIKNIGNNEYLPGINITDREWESLTNKYVDGCIRILVDLTDPFAYNDGVVFSEVPEIFDVKKNRNKTWGDFYDDYQTKRNQ